MKVITVIVSEQRNEKIIENFKAKEKANEVFKMYSERLAYQKKRGLIEDYELEMGE